MGRNMARQNATVPGTLDAGQSRAIQALISGTGVAVAAEQAGVHRGTLHRWMTDDPAFLAAYNLAQQQLAEAVAQNLRTLAAEAVGVLRTVMTNEATPPAIRVRAALEVIKAAPPPPEGPTTTEGAESELKDRASKAAYARLRMQAMP